MSNPDREGEFPTPTGAPDGWVTLAHLAAEARVTPDSLRQRVHRGTLLAAKVGNTWLVPPGEALRVLAQRRQP